MAIGNLIISEPSPIKSDFDRFRVYRSTTQSGTFSRIGPTAGTLLTAPSFFDIDGTIDSWYRTTFWNNSDEDETDQSDAFQPQNEKYTTVRELQKFLRLPTIADDTTPSIQEVTNLIKTMQDDIDHQCLEENTRIHTGTNYVKIKDIKKGDKVFTYDLKEKKIVESEVKRLIDNGEKDVYLLRSMNREIKVTEDHLFLVVRKTINPMKEIYDKFIKEDNGKESNVITSKKWKVSDETIRLWRGRKQKPREYLNTIEWEQLKNIAIADKILISNMNTHLYRKSRKLDYVKTNSTNLKKVNIPTETSENLMKLLGGFIGDGCISHDQLNISEYNPFKIGIYKELISNLFDCDVKEYGHGLTINSLEICNFIKYTLEFEKTNAHEKRIPEWFYSLPSNEIKAFLDGVIMSDGCFSENRTYILLCNEPLLKQIKDLCEIINIPTTKIVETKAEGFGKIHTRYSISLHLNGKKMGGQYKRLFVRVGENVGFNYVSSIEHIGKSKVYDIEIDNENHNFIAQGIVVHNCGHAWRKRYSGTNAGADQTAKFEYIDLDNFFEWHTGRPIYLKHRFLYTMDATEGDALGVWDGSAYVNYLTTKTEGRKDDFFFLYDQGILFINARWGITRSIGIRIKYRYGERVLNNIVQRVCVRMVAKELVYGDTRNTFVAGGDASALTQSERISRWDKEIEAGLTRIREWKLMGMNR